MLRQSLSNMTQTQNGALAYKSTKSHLVDFFASAGTARNMSDEEIIALFDSAMLEDERTAIVLMFHFRDILEGQGERRLFRVLYKHLALVSPAIAHRLMPLVPEYGRWDDLYALVDTSIESHMFDFLYEQFLEDLKSEKPSLLGKWLKGCRPSSQESKRLMRKTYQAFKLNPVQYRKRVSALRRKIGIVETQMCQNNWSEINYSKVPSQAMKQYIRAFSKHDGERFGEYLEALESPVLTKDVKINTKTLYPHQIVAPLLDTSELNDGFETQARALNVMWNNLPDYSLEDTLPVIDVSGSMYAEYSGSKNVPLHASVGLGLYCAEHLEGEFENSFITFSERPTFVEIDKTLPLVSKIYQVKSSQWGYNTNLEAVFNLILARAVHSKVPQSQMPKRVLIISDMEFDEASRRENTIFEQIQKKFAEEGYETPQLIFWNVAGRTDQYPATNSAGALLLSGFSPVALKYLYSGEMLTPLDLVKEVVNSERYKAVSELVY